MITFNEVMQHLNAGKTVELKFHLNGFLFSRHTLTLVGGKIEDESGVDGSTSSYTIEQYQVFIPRKSIQEKRCRTIRSNHLIAKRSINV